METHLAELIQRFNTEVNGRAPSGSLTLMHESGLSLPQIIVLSALQAAGTQSISQIAELTRLSAPAASQLVDRLVEGGYISREADPSDRRVRVVAIRAKGAKLVEQLSHVRRDELEQACARLPRALRGRFADVLGEVVACFEKAHET
jgi:DNA-binding MarR family transcriptional regulator